MPPQILIAYATRKGSTADIAHEIGSGLVSAGYHTVIAEMKSVSSLEGYDAVIIGTPVYTGTILPEVAGFATRYRDKLCQLPVAGFVTGLAPVFPPAGDPATFTGQLARALDPAQLLAVTMFAGRLEPRNLSFIERGLTALLKAPPGNFLDRQAIASWVQELTGVPGFPPTTKD